MQPFFTSISRVLDTHVPSLKISLLYDIIRFVPETVRQNIEDIRALIADPGFLSFEIGSRWRKYSRMEMSANFSASIGQDCSQMLWYLKQNWAHFAAEKLNDNQAGALKRCSGAFFMPERCGGSETFVPRMVSYRVSMDFIFYAEREL